jgi:hypothetical protein
MTPGAGAFGAYEVDAFLADSVSVAGGRLFAHSAGWDHVLVPGLPARPGRVGIGVMLRIPEARAGKSFTLGLRLEGPDGSRWRSPCPTCPTR